MKKFIAKVNGKEYVVEVTEVGTTDSVTTQPVYTAPVEQPVEVTTQKVETKQAAPVVNKPALSGGKGSVRIEAPMPGTILAVKVSVGQAVKKNQVVAVLEAMKMENDIVAAQEGVVASVDISNGASVEAGQLLVSLN